MMTEDRILLDPTAELSPSHRARQARPDSLEGLTIGLLDISKARGDVFLAQLQKRMGELGLSTKRYRKPTFARIAPSELKQQITAECDVVVEALAD
jgi:hypothetical protein